MSSPMHICFLCNEYPPGPHGGIGTLIQVLARAFVRAGHQVRVVGIYQSSYPAPDYEEDQGVRVWRLREPDHRFGWALIRRQLFRTIARWSRDGKIHVVEVPDYLGLAAGWPRLPVPIIARLSGAACYFRSEMGRRLRPTTFWLERASLRRADFWCSESFYVAEKTQRLFRLDTAPDAVLYNPVEMPACTSPTIRAKNRVVFAGALTAKKGIISLIRAWPRVKEFCGEAELHIFGDGRTDDGQPMQTFLLSQLADQLKESVHFHGRVPLEDLLTEFRRAHVTVLPSYAEGFALTPLHAMACECPTIYTRRGSGPELIKHGRDGLLVDPDQPEDIADAVVRLLTDDQLAGRLGRAGCELVKKNFSVQSLLSRNEEFYRRCLNDFHQNVAQRG